MAYHKVSMVCIFWTLHHWNNSFTLFVIQDSTLWDIEQLKNGLGQILIDNQIWFMTKISSSDIQEKKDVQHNEPQEKWIFP